MAAERPACGLGALLSASCRDRAEAFARRLHSRLQTLGLGAGDAEEGEGEEDAPPPRAEAQAHARTPPEERPPKPPLRLGSSSDSDPYYDFDLQEEPESPASPAEDALALELVVEQPRPAPPPPGPASTEPESGCTSSFFGTSPGSDESFESPSASPAWFTARRRSSPPTLPPAPFDKCNGHAPRENGSAYAVWENGSARTVWENGPSHAPLENGSAATVQEDGPTRIASGALRYDDDALHIAFRDDNEDAAERNSGASAVENDAVHVRNTHNLESANETERFTELISSLESASAQEEDGSERPAQVISEKEEGDVECGDRVEVTPSEAVSVQVCHDEEIELLPFEEGKENCRYDEDVDRPGGGGRLDDWEDWFSDYGPSEVFPGDEGIEKGENEEQEKDERKEVAENLSRWQGESYQSTFSRSAELTLECPSQASDAEAEAASALAERGELPRRPSWESLQQPAAPSLVPSREDDLELGVQAPEVLSGGGAAAEDAHEEREEGGPCAAPPPPPPPRVVCDLSPDEAPAESSPTKPPQADRLQPETQRSNSKDQPEDDDDEESSEEEGAVKKEESPRRRRRLRRCSSLKTGKTPPGTPSRKKIVRFADALGLDLADVRTFLDEIPRVPRSAYDDLHDADLSLGSAANPALATGGSADPALALVSGPDPGALGASSSRALAPSFQQPGGQPDFLERVRTRFVCLESAAVQDAATSAIAGAVRVRNLDFHKSVFVRYSIDGWKSFADLQATYVPHSCDGFSDKFSFVLFAHTLLPGQRLEFALRFQCRGAQYWDSNGGANYAFQCLPASASAAPAPPALAPLALGAAEDRWGFY